MFGKSQDGAKVQVLEEKPCKISLKVQWPASHVQKEAEQAYLQIQRDAKLPGFRPGKVPLDVVKKTFSDRAKAMVVDHLLSQGVLSAAQEKKIAMVSRPVVESMNFLWDQPFSFQFTVETHPKFEPKDYKKIKLERGRTNVSEEEVTKELEAIRDRNARLVPAADEPITKDHFVVVDYDATVQGQPLAGAKAENQLIQMSSPQMLSGFTEGLLQAKEGETKEIPIRFPQDYFKKELAGQEAVFTVMIRNVKSKSLPALDDEFAKDLGVTTLAEVRDRLTKGLGEKKKREVQKSLEDQISKHLLAANPIVVPASLVEEETEHLLKRAHAFLREQGLADAQWKLEEPKWRQKCQKEGEERVRLAYILQAIGHREKIEVSEEDLQRERQRLADSSQMDAAAVDKYFQEHRDLIARSVREEKIFQFLIENAKITES